MEEEQEFEMVQVEDKQEIVEKEHEQFKRVEEEQEQCERVEEKEVENEMEPSSSAAVQQFHPVAQQSLLPPSHILLLQENNKAVTGGESQRGTRSYPHYCLDANLSLEDFHFHLQKLDGGRKSEREARQVAMDVAKYLHFANSHQVNWGTLVDLEAVKAYIKELKKMSWSGS